jgi:hypothetical protein
VLSFLFLAEASGIGRRGAMRSGPVGVDAGFWPRRVRFESLLLSYSPAWCKRQRARLLTVSTRFESSGGSL